MTELDKLIRAMVVPDMLHVHVPEELKVPSMRADVIETDTGYKIKLDVPGFTKDEISIKVHNGNLIVKAKKEETSEENAVVKERHTELSRVFSLKDKIDVSSITAELDNGVLIISCNKKEKEVAQDITIETKEK